MTGGQVPRLCLRGKESGIRPIGAECIGGGKLWFADAAHEIILAAGAVGGSHMLQLSGIGSAALLQ